MGRRYGRLLFQLLGYGESSRERREGEKGSAGASGDGRLVVSSYFDVIEEKIGGEWSRDVRSRMYGHGNGEGFHVLEITALP